MYEDCRARLVMKRTILSGEDLDETSYYCKVITYDEETEDIYLLVGKKALTDFSMDAIYECSIHENGSSISCQGMIRQRYYSKQGRALVFHIQNGFYKNIVN